MANWQRYRNKGGTKLGSCLRFRYRSETNLLISELVKIEAKRILIIPQIRKIEAERTLFIPQIGKSEAKKTNWIEVKQTEVVFFYTFMEPRNQFRGIDSLSLCPGRPVQQPYSFFFFLLTALGPTKFTIMTKAISLS
jgi:hypothetical protein